MLSYWYILCERSIKWLFIGSIEYNNVDSYREYKRIGWDISIFNRIGRYRGFR